MSKNFTMIPAAVVALALAGCDSQAENEVELQAEAIDEAAEGQARMTEAFGQGGPNEEADRKSTRLNSSHLVISYAVFCL